MIHYHGTPITPRERLLTMRGRHFCVSYAEPRDLETALQIGQSVMFDNGAFSAHTNGAAFDRVGYYDWLRRHGGLAHPNWAVVPDVIDGDVEEQRALVREWPFSRHLGAPVWHLAMPVEYLLELSAFWPKICLGSTREYWEVGSERWCRRMDEAFNALCRAHSQLPWIHGLRMLGQAGADWPLASADSSNVAQNWRVQNGFCCPEAMARELDAKQSPTKWTEREEQCRLFT